MTIKIKITKQENANYFSKELNSIIEIDFEKYVATVVASEIGNSNIEACKAQAIAARTYAVYRGVLNGKVISDDSTVAQAYRAPRYNKTFYPNCIQAAEDTKGQILIYNNKPIEAVYSSCNGGYTVSCEERWGNKVPYLIAKEDPWDAITNKKKDGHGVGLSQVGTIWAGNNEFTYKDILNFYYPNTIISNIEIEKISILKQQLSEWKQKLIKIRERL